MLSGPGYLASFTQSYSRKCIVLTLEFFLSVLTEHGEPQSQFKYKYPLIWLWSNLKAICSMGESLFSLLVLPVVL